MIFNLTLVKFTTKFEKRSRINAQVFEISLEVNDGGILLLFLELLEKLFYLSCSNVFLCVFNLLYIRILARLRGFIHEAATNMFMRTA